MRAGWVGPFVAAVQALNLLDWGTTLVGVGLLGLPEREPASAWLIAHLGVLWGMTMLHGAAAAGFAGLVRSPTGWDDGRGAAGWLA